MYRVSTIDALLKILLCGLECNKVATVYPEQRQLQVFPPIFHVCINLNNMRMCEYVFESMYTHNGASTVQCCYTSSASAHIV